MPSGSHRSSRSHSSSSSRSFRSSYSGTSHSRGGIRHHHGGMYYGGRHRGGLVVVGNGIIPIMIFLLVFIVVMSVFVGSYGTDAKKIRQEYEYYNQMIDRALDNSEYTAQAKVTSMHESNGRYYVTYTIEGKDFPDDWGISFPIYTMKEASDLMVNGVTLALAKNINEMTAFTDSVPIDHTIDKIEIDSDYTQCNKMKVICIVIDCVLIVIEALVIAFAVYTFIKRKKQGENETSTESSTTQQYRCNHCGARIPAGSNKCSACGSSDCSKVNE